jgi:hypothetical protein
MQIASIYCISTEKIVSLFILSLIMKKGRNALGRWRMQMMGRTVLWTQGNQWYDTTACITHLHAWVLKLYRPEIFQLHQRRDSGTVLLIVVF